MEKEVCSLITLQSFFTSMSIGRNIINDVNDKKEMDFFLVFYQYMVRETIKLFGMDHIQKNIISTEGITELDSEEMYKIYNSAIEFVLQKKAVYEEISMDDIV